MTTIHKPYLDAIKDAFRDLVEADKIRMVEDPTRPGMPMVSENGSQFFTKSGNRNTLSRQTTKEFMWLL